MTLRTCTQVCIMLLTALMLNLTLTAQTGVAVSGRLLNSLSGDPIGGATVQIDELRRQTISAPDGTFTFENVPPGTYHVSVRSSGYSSRRTEVTVASAAVAPGDHESIPSCTSKKCLGRRHGVAQPVRGVPADVRSRGPGAGEAARDVARRARSRTSRVLRREASARRPRGR